MSSNNFSDAQISKSLFTFYKLEHGMFMRARIQADDSMDSCLQGLQQSQYLCSKCSAVSKFVSTPIRTAIFDKCGSCSQLAVHEKLLTAAELD